MATRSLVSCCIYSTRADAIEKQLTAFTLTLEAQIQHVKETDIYESTMVTLELMKCDLDIFGISDILMAHHSLFHTETGKIAIQLLLDIALNKIKICKHTQSTALRAYCKTLLVQSGSANPTNICQLLEYLLFQKTEHCAQDENIRDVSFGSIDPSDSSFILQVLMIYSCSMESHAIVFCKSIIGFIKVN